jgi:hypothetical protein
LEGGGVAGSVSMYLIDREGGTYSQSLKISVSRMMFLRADAGAVNSTAATAARRTREANMIGERSWRGRIL